MKNFQHGDTDAHAAARVLIRAAHREALIKTHTPLPPQLLEQVYKHPQTVTGGSS